MSDLEKIAQSIQALVGNGDYDRTSDILESLQQVQAEATGEWISCADRLPEYGVFVLVIDAYGWQNVGEYSQHYDGYNWRDQENKIRVTHWRALPVPPVQEDNK